MVEPSRSWEELRGTNAELEGHILRSLQATVRRMDFISGEVIKRFFRKGSHPDFVDTLEATLEAVEGTEDRRVQPVK